MTFRALICCWFLQAALAISANAIEPLVVERGPVKAMILLEPEEPVIGDTLTLTLEAEAEKGVELLMPEFGEALEVFTILDFVPRQRVGDAGQTIATHQYRLQAPASGNHAIPPILIEFVDRRPGEREAPEGEDAYELLTERIEFHVASVLPTDATDQLKPLLGELAPLESDELHWEPWVAGLLIGVTLLGMFAFRQWRRQRQLARRRSAYEIARDRLERLLAAPRPSASEIDIFYVELSGIIRRYLEDRFELRAPELTTEEFLETVGQSSALSRVHQALLREFLRNADLVKFAGVQPVAEDIKQAIETARQFVEETRENAPLVDAPLGDRPPGDGSPGAGSEVTTHV